jgi:hypothetical protein
VRLTDADYYVVLSYSISKMEPAAKKLKRSQPVLPLSLIRDVVTLCVEAQTFKKYCLEGHHLWLTFGGKLVLEDIRDYRERGSYSSEADIISRQKAAWLSMYSEPFIIKGFDVEFFEGASDYYTSILMSIIKDDWVDRFEHYVDKNDYESYMTVNYIMGEEEDV